MQFVHKQVVDGVDVVERSVLQRLHDHGLTEVGQLQHVVYHRFVELGLSFGACVDGWSITQPSVLDYLGDRQSFVGVNDQHVSYQVFAVYEKTFIL